MSLIVIPNVFTVGSIIIASQHNANFSTIYSDYNGNIIDSNIASNANVSYSKLNLNNSVKASDLASSLSVFLIPSGGIIMWSGTIATIPSGWFLCNGSNSTPDLRDRFVIAADADSGGTYNVGSSGDGSIPSHTHSISQFSNVGASGSGALTSLNNSLGTTGSFGTGTKVIATYYALAFIMKS